MSTRWRPYGLAAALTLASVTVTSVTWPLFAAAPYAPVFAAVAAVSHWGSGPAGIVATAMAAVGAALTFPTSGPSPFNPLTLLLFIPVALIGSRIIAGRKRALAILRANEAQLRATWEHATLGIALLDPSGRVERINPAMVRLLGHTAAAAVGMPFGAFSPPDDSSAEQERFSRFLAGTVASYQREQRFRRRDGSEFWGRVTVSVIRGPNKVPAGALAVLEDVTSQRQAEADLRESEERLRRAQKMEAVGRLVAGVAHNFNNLMTITMGYTDVLLDRHQGGGPDAIAVHEIRKATERGAALTRQLLAFGRKHDAGVARVDLSRALTGLRDMLTRVVREDIRLTIQTAPGPVTVMIDPHDLEQIVVNLVLNARDALPFGGAIHIDVGRERVEAANPRLDPAAAPGEYARLRVRDDGVGMSREVQAHLFEPFFTTKEVGEGTGLGLAFVHGIARHGRGFVTVDSAPGKGTTVAVYLPPVTGAATSPAEESPSASGSVNRPAATILLVEDDAGVRSMTERMLTRAGYRVFTAALPSDAVALFDRHAREIDVLVTDVVMPEMHGPALAEKLAAERPGLRVLFVSGYSDVMPASAQPPATVGFLAKPFTASRLLDAITGLLAASGN